jgi:hypothetical protein
MAKHLTMAELEAGLAAVSSPADGGRLELIVRRPAVGEREILEEGDLDLAVGLVGDTWNRRGSSRTPDRSPHPDMQLTLMNARAVDLIAGARARWPLAGDQLYVDLNLSVDNLTPGTQLAIGPAVIEVTAQPHTGCHKFTSHFGVDATKFVNSDFGRRLNLRGINARVVVPGRIRAGESVRKVVVGAYHEPQRHRDAEIL